MPIRPSGIFFLMSNMLNVAYAANIVILGPVVAAVLFAQDANRTVFENRFTQSPELIALVGCLWASILICSAIGIFYPAEMAPVLLLQVIYKALYLALLLGPLVVRNGVATIPL
jgi:hypothetical protein